MPKRVDHQERRELISAALMRLLAREGLESISLRTVAAEAGVSAGQVQHYFPSKEAMMEFAWYTLTERVSARLAGADYSDLPALFSALLPSDAESADDARSLLGYLAFAVVRPPVLARIAENSRAFRDYVTTQLDPGSQDRVRAQRAASELLALLEGLGIHIISGQLTVDEARDILNTAINRAMRPRTS